MEVAPTVVRLRLAETFVIAREARDWEDVVQVEARHAGHVGRGEAAPIDRYDETAESALAFVEQHGDVLGDDPFALEQIGERLAEIPGEHAAKAALDGALHDLQGKMLGVPVWKLLGLPRAGLRPRGRSGSATRTTWPGAPSSSAVASSGSSSSSEAVTGWTSSGFAPCAPRTDLPLQVDVNEWWSLDEALESIPQLVELGVAYIEQPLPAGDAGAEELRATSPIPIYVDEDCHTLADVARCAEIAHGINIKLAKSGGIREAIRMAHAARALDLGVMLGCMVESGIGIAAGCVVAPLCDHVDLDGNLLLAEDPCPGVAFVDGVQLPSEEPGLGVG